MAAVFQEDLKNTSQKIFDPQDRILVRLNRSFLISCIISIAIDPMFFYGPRVREEQLPGEKNTNLCIGIDDGLAISTAVVRTLFDIFFLARIALQFRTAFIAPSSRVFGRGELAIDTVEIAKRYCRRFFIAEVFSVLPLPQLAIWKFLYREDKTAVLETKDRLLSIIIAQYVPWLVRIYPLSTEFKRTSGVFAETALAGAAYYLFWYMLASHIMGAFWYLLSIERVTDCWRFSCNEFPGCNQIYMYCGKTKSNEEYTEWTTVIR
jgi:cyclic nucleotide gated channel